MAAKIPAYAERMKWFHEARFGMFIHFGLYSVLGRAEWVMYRERIPAAEYAKVAARFNPRELDAGKWARLARSAGMKYMVLTARHHDGFCLWDTGTTDFKSTNTPFGRDIVAEYVEAARKEGMRVGIYYSLCDWRFPGYFEPVKQKESKAALVRQVHDQVRELMTGYGRIDVLWYDGGWLMPDYKTEGMAGFWRSKELNRMVRSLQPNILINNRSGVKEDLDTPEQRIEASEPGRGWESCMTMPNYGWGYVRHNPTYKTTAQLIQNLIHTAAGEGNFLLNVGPKGNGAIRKREARRLGEIGRWMKANGESIYGSRRCELTYWQGSLLGEWTVKGDKAYFHIYRWPGREAAVPLVATKALSARMMATGEPVEIRREANGRLIFTGLPKRPPSPWVNTIEVKFAGEPRLIAEKDMAAWIDGALPKGV